MDPIEIVVHERRAEPAGAPLAQVGVDAFGLPGKIRTILKQFPVVLKVMHPHLKTLPNQLGAHFPRNTDFAFRNEIERRPEPEFHLERHQLMDVADPPGAFHVMREYQGEFLPARPAGPVPRWLGGGGVDGPHILVGPQRSPGKYPPQPHPETPREIGLYLVVNAGLQHWRLANRNSVNGFKMPPIEIPPTQWTRRRRRSRPQESLRNSWCSRGGT